ncbi:hypothetical protein GCM10023093_26300 [Nemorincola caseinilytica]|uniref:Uncharacterized protein n=1 Tax=Nemorincola caseinilytica TaxID=2054315 RepID=A0ABP8NMZ7_9BACT
MRTRKPTNGKVKGVKFTISKTTEENDLKKVKEQLLKDLEEKEKNDKEWYDKEMDKNLKKP